MSTLAVRDDRLGDLVLTLPALDALARAYGPLTVAASVGNADLLLHDPRVAALELLPPAGRARLRAFRSLLRRRRPERVVFFRGRFPLGWIARLLGVPDTVGALSSLDGLAHRRRVRQRRSRARRSEADFGAELARLAGAPEPGAAALSLPVRYRERARRWVERVWMPGARTRVGVHPGTGGSARNWDAERYGRLVEALAAREDVAVVVTASAGEEALARRVARRRAAVHVGWAGPLAHAGVLAELDVLVSGSTGSMHLAAAVGTATVSIFSAIRAESPVRWGALGERAVALAPDVPACERCVGDRCPVWDCMERIDIERVVELVRERRR